MNRRHFLNALTAFTATAVLDPEKLLWKPGKLISIPKPRQPQGMWFHYGTLGPMKPVEWPAPIDPDTGLSIRIVRSFDLEFISSDPVLYLPVKNNELLAKLFKSE